MRKFWLLGILCAAALGAADHGKKQTKPDVEVPLGLLPIAWPRDNPYSPAKAELGRFLYFDARLSADDSVSCASCHSPKSAFADGSPVSTGIHGQKGGRSAPTIFNRAYSLAQFWDGRAGTLEEQAVGPMANPIEMGSTAEAVVKRLSTIPGYQPLFEKAFGAGPITMDHAAQAIATFERTVLSGNSAFDRYQAGDKKALSAAQVRGMDVFYNRAKCDKCHEGINFTTNAYHNLGVGINKLEPDLGRFAVTKDAQDWGAFKTPTLRDIALTRPYMHDGSETTLEAVVDYYDKGGTPNKNLDSDIRPLHLKDGEKKDLVECLKSLSGDGWQKIQPPAKLPE